ncbi:MAG: 6-phosphogluconolactonase [Sneathiella sp.]
MICPDEYLYSDTAVLNAALSASVAETLRARISAHGKAVLVVSGGSTPQMMLQALSQQKLDWSKVTILLADERWVDPSSDRSNEKMVRACLLQNEAKDARFKGLHLSGCKPDEAPSRLEEGLAFLEEGIDVLLLGMGEDGHTASLFPCAENISDLLSEQNDAKTVMVRPQTAPDTRISLSFGVLVKAGLTCLHITGEMKKEIWQKVSSGHLEAPVGQVFKKAQGQIRLYWAP